MPTPLTKSVTRVVTTARGERLNVTLAPEGIVVREVRRRKSLPAVPYGLVFITAAKIAAEALRVERAKARKLKRLTR